MIAAYFGLVWLQYYDTHCPAYTETQLLTIWINSHQWLHRQLSFWQLLVQPLMKIKSKLQHYRFNIVSVLDTYSPWFRNTRNALIFPHVTFSHKLWWRRYKCPQHMLKMFNIVLGHQQTHCWYCITVDPFLLKFFWMSMITKKTFNQTMSFKITVEIPRNLVAILSVSVLINTKVHFKGVGNISCFASQIIFFP